MKPILILAFNTGMRAGEIVNLRWNHIDLKSGFIRLTEADTKEGKDSCIPLSYHARNALSGLIRHIHYDYVFTYKSKPIKMIFYIFGLCCKQAGLPYGRKEDGVITFHDIRRTVKTNMLKAGVDEVFQNVILGHTLKGMDKHYIQVEEDDLKKPIRKYTEWFDNELTKLQNVDLTVDQKVNF